ncbi:GNAT family N-acetyltransferase [Wenxinia marina]|uniref:Acetyltransferase n=1 Tax=Wenxinia marina DSM 24838 TaxID=1123501 RepID=A0A0D0Q7V1_9RHOB|nr:GNAT family N-acetyltransferase [Wenxinia marina]KIQ70529.1 Acetyltransferase [Wenxinia marina DSM 24838]GGL52429.1 alanine acetyltransferase [Wenxinia marina]
MTPAALAALHAAAFPDERGWSAGEFAALLAAPGAVLEVHGPAFVLGRVIADEAEILTLATDPAHRRQGHARAALAAFEDGARAAGAEAVFLDVAEDNDAARALYAVAGYQEAGRRRRYYARKDGPATDALVLRKRIASPHF